MKRVFLVCSLLLMSSFAGISCKDKPAPTPSGSNSADTAPAAAPASESSPAFEYRGPGERLVKSVGTWQITGRPRYFGPETLYDLIDGGAEVYTAYGLKEMVTADYTSKDKAKVTVTAEIYDMGDALHAFGRFSKFLQGRDDPSSAAKGLPARFAGRGLFGGANASFWKGSYLVNLTVLDEGDNATVEGLSALGAEVLPPMAEALDDGIIGETALPSEISLFPEANLLSGSFLFEPSLFGIESLGPGFAAAYKSAEKTWTLFVTVPFADESAAAAAAQKASAEIDAKPGLASPLKNRIVGAVYPDASVKADTQKALKTFTAAVSGNAR